MKLQCLTRYDDMGASSRVRMSQYLAALVRLAPDWSIQRQSLLDAAYLQRKYAGRDTVAATLRCYARRAQTLARDAPPDLWWIEKELWPYAPAWLERRLLAARPYVLDFDDAIFHNYDLHRFALVRGLLGGKIDLLMAKAALVTAGNAYLADRARAAGAPWVEIVPTAVDLDHYPMPEHENWTTSQPVDIVWIGSPATAAYLDALSGPLQELAARRSIRLVTIGAGARQIPGVEVLSLPWSAASEAADIARCQIGVMPLPDSPWERGKCGYKLIQYMACGLPVVASPVGVNSQIVRGGHNGWLATDSTQWLQHLGALVDDAAMRRRLGRAGRRMVEQGYSVQALAPRLAAMLREAAGRSVTDAGMR
jgi:glycosyltransferase involved in cell wall biosynthesis